MVDIAVIILSSQGKIVKEFYTEINKEYLAFADSLLSDRVHQIFKIAADEEIQVITIN